MDICDKVYSQETYVGLLSELEVSAQEYIEKIGGNWANIMQSTPANPTALYQMAILLKYGLFDEGFYRRMYRDVDALDISPIVHYIHHGDSEGRWPNKYFNPKFYRDNFLGEDVGPYSTLYHYAVFGEAIGLPASEAFNAQRYLISNPPLRSWLDMPLTHYLHLGVRCGLRSNLRRAHLSDAKVNITKEECPEFLTSSEEDLSRSVNLIGPLDKISGLGVSARGYFEGLCEAGVEKLGTRSQQREFAIQASRKNEYSKFPFQKKWLCNLVHMNGDTLPSMLQDGGKEIFSHRFNVAIWYWELPTLRPEWQASMKYFHEFWAPTPFIAEALSGSTAKRIVTIPPYLPQLKGMVDKRVVASLNKNQFLYCFDANSILERKNPVALLDAFWLAFPKERCNVDVKLTFKITYPNKSIPDVRRLYEAAEIDSRVEIIDGVLTDDEFHSLISNCTAYISPHRSEGLGLTIIEAMAGAVPVIAPKFGGVEFFIRDDSAYPVNFSLQELEGDYIPYPQGFVWADPDVRSIAECMVSVISDEKTARDKAQLARDMVLDYFCSADLIEKYRSELSRIAKTIQFGGDVDGC